MRKISENIQSLLESDFISYFYLVKVGTIMRHCSVNMDITYNGQTYLGNSKLKSVDPPRLTSNVDRESYKIAYADSDFGLRPYFEENLVGKPLTVYLGFFNTTSGTLSGYAPGLPITSLADVIVAYEGTVDNPSYTIDPNGEVIATIEGTSPMTALDMVNAFYTSKDSMRQRQPDDSSFDQVYEGYKGIELLWGKIKDG